MSKKAVIQSVCDKIEEIDKVDFYWRDHVRSRKKRGNMCIHEKSCSENTEISRDTSLTKFFINRVVDRDPVIF